MRDEMMAETLAKTSKIMSSGTQVPFEDRPDQAAIGADELSRVEIALTGFTVRSVWMDPTWVAEATPLEVQQATQEALQNALHGLVDAEMRAARETSYEAADVQTQLMKLAQEASVAMNDRIRSIGGAV